MNVQYDIEMGVPKFYDFATNGVVMFLRGNSLDMHYQMRRPRETNELLAMYVGIKDGDNVLDMGCGLGSSASWAALRFNCKVDGVTISKNEQIAAVGIIKKMKLSERVQIFHENMLAMHFPDDAHSVVWAIESMCHTGEKMAFVHEAYRNLAPGGRLVIADFFLTDSFTEIIDGTDYQRFREGFHVPSLCTKDAFLEMLTNEGFQNVRYMEHTKEILSCAREREIAAWLNIPFILPLSLLRLLPRILMKNTLAMIAQGRLFRHNKFSYGVVYAEK